MLIYIHIYCLSLCIDVFVLQNSADTMSGDHNYCLPPPYSDTLQATSDVPVPSCDAEVATAEVSTSTDQGMQ